MTNAKRKGFIVMADIFAILFLLIMPNVLYGLLLETSIVSFIYFDFIELAILSLIAGLWIGSQAKEKYMSNTIYTGVAVFGWKMLNMTPDQVNAFFIITLLIVIFGPLILGGKLMSGRKN